MERHCEPLLASFQMHSILMGIISARGIHVGADRQPDVSMIYIRASSFALPIASAGYPPDGHRPHPQGRRDEDSVDST